MSEKNICIFKLEKTLDEIIPLLNNTYYKPIDDLNELNCDRKDKNCIYKWLSISDNGFEKKNITVSGTTFEYVEAIARIEYVTMTKSKRELLSKRVTLDKGMLVDVKASEVFFVSYLGSVYSIISGPKDLEGKIRSTLMEMRNKKESSWGAVYYKDISQYSFMTSFYYWVIDKKKIELTNNENTIKILDLKGFKSSDIERDTSSFSGEGENIDRRIPLKSIISMGERLVNLYIYMAFNDVIYSFVLHNDGRLTLFLSECGQFGVSEPRILEYKEVVLTIYFFIIPFLNAEFNKVKIKNWDEHEKRIQKVYAMDIIVDLIKSNDLDLTDLKTAIDSVS